MKVADKESPGVKILSLFDGMACGMIAMLQAGVEVESYDAYEIDKYAIKVATHNFPNIKEHGDVFEADFTQYEGVDFLVGGSPCTYWSIAQTKNRETVASGMGWELFSQYVRALHEAKPKFFIYENNKSMSRQIRASIDKAFGFEAVLINSALVSAQNRQRLYWVGKRNEDGTYSKVNVEQPADRGILLKNVLDSVEPLHGMVNDKKSRTLTANYWKTNVRDAFVDCAGGRTMVAEPINTDANGKAFCVTSRYYKGFGNNPGKCLEKHRDSMVAEPINVTDGGKSQTLKAQYCKNSVANFCCYSSTYGASGVAEPINVTASGKAKTISASYAYKGDGEGSLKSELFPDNPIKQTSNYVAESVAFSMVGDFGNRKVSVSDKAYCLAANPSSDMSARVAEPVCVAERGRMYCGQPQHYEARTDGKTNTLTTVLKDNQIMEPIPAMPVKEATAKGYTEIECGDCVDLSMPNSKTRRGRNMKGKSNCMQTSNDFYQYVAYAIEFDDDGRPIKAIGKDGKEITIYEVRDGKITIKGKQYPIKLKDGFYIIRKLTVSECKRLQTVPEWYEFPVSNSQAYKMLGNGWTCEVIAHLIRSCMAEQWG